MDGSQFDDLLRSLANSRRTLLGSVLAAASVSLSGSHIQARKKKKKCAQKCTAGCCTGKYGKCIQPTQQSPGQCGTGGEICRSTCAGGGCTPVCAGKPPCAPDGCGGICETCGSGQRCQNGACGCPPETPHFCNNRCQECCSADHCPKFGAQDCDVDGTGLCTCWERTHKCADGLCWPCCSSDHCRERGRAPEDGFSCTLESHSCVCQEGTTECLKPDGSGDYYCVNIRRDDQNCGECGFSCTKGGTPFHCDNGSCVRND